MLIAEFSHNHKGKDAILKEMIFRAKEAGAWACKIQTFFADDLADDWKHTYARVKESELNWDMHRKFVGWCNETDIVPMTSVYDFKYAGNLADLGFRWIKIGSAQASDADLINCYIGGGFNLIVSTGGRGLDQIYYRPEIKGMLHCVSKYPHSPYESSLLRMLDIKARWPDSDYGLSDHVDSAHREWFLPAFMAVYLGAKYIEKHFTLLGRMDTKDGPVSINQKQLKMITDFAGWTIDRQEEELARAGSFLTLRRKYVAEQFDVIKEYEGRWKTQ